MWSFQYHQCAGPQKQEVVNGHSSIISWEKIKVGMFPNKETTEIWKKKFVFFSTFKSTYNGQNSKFQFSKLTLSLYFTIEFKFLFHIFFVGILRNSVLEASDWWYCKHHKTASNSLSTYTPGLSGVWDQNWVNSALYIAFWSVKPTDFKNVITENIPPALSLLWPACLLKFHRKQKRRKFYYEKS